MNKTPHVVILCLSIFTYPYSSSMPSIQALIFCFLLTIIQVKCVFELIRTDEKRKAPVTVPIHLEVNYENSKEA